MKKITLSTGHKELDDILRKNGITDQEEQEKQENEKQLKRLQEFLELNSDKEENIGCAHDAYNRQLVREGTAKTIAEAARMPRWLCCRCEKCNPCKWGSWLPSHSEEFSRKKYSLYFDKEKIRL